MAHPVGTILTGKLAHHDFVWWLPVDLDDGMRRVKQGSVGGQNY